MYTRLFIFIFIVLCNAQLHAKSDSLKVAQLLDSMLIEADRKDYFQNEIEKIAQKNINNPEVIADIWLLQSRFYIMTGDIESAKAIKDKGISKFKDNPLLFAGFKNIEGSIFARSVQFNEAVNSFQTALKIYDSLGVNQRSAYIKNNIANIFFNLNDFESSYPYALESFSELYRINDTIYYPQIAAVLAISAAKTGKQEEAKAHANLAISSGKKYKNPVAVILGEYALGDLYSIQEKWEEAKNHYQTVSSSSVQLGLAQYEMYGLIGLISSHVSLKEYEEAVQHADRVIEITEKLNINYSDYTIYQQLSEAYNALGQYDKAYQFLYKANSLFREYNKIETNKNIQELLIKYEAQKKESELALKKLKLARSSNWILILSLALIILIVFILSWRSRNRDRLLKLRIESSKKQHEAYLEGEQRERERIASDIHDGIASTLTGLALKIKQVKSLNEIPVFYDYINKVRNEVRLVSKNIQPFNLKEQGWNNAFQQFLETIQSDELMVFFISEFNEKHFNNQKGIVVYRLIQELIQNTLKHAKASECEIIISEEKNNILIQYSDNGIGASKEELKKGNGWQSILKRINAIEGEISFPINPLNGLKIDILIPKEITL